jgi:hypothetical protein
MLQRRREPGFVDEHFDKVGTYGELGQHPLDDEDAIEPSASPRHEYLRHTAGGDVTVQFVVAEDLTHEPSHPQPMQDLACQATL